MKHNHHNESSLLVKFVRRGIPISNSLGINGVVKRNFVKSEVVRICMDSPFYFDMNYSERNSLVNRLTGK